MKKKLLFLLVGGLFLLGGCGKATESDIIKDLTKKINNANSYYIEGTLEIMKISIHMMLKYHMLEKIIIK